MAKKGSLTVRIIGDEKSFTGALGKARKGAEGFASKLPGILGIAGAAGGAALAAGLFEAFERDAQTDRLGAALNLDPREMEQVGRLSGEIWADAFGDGIEDVQGAMEGVISTLGGFEQLGVDGIDRVTRKALTVADVFNLDVSEAISAAGVLLSSGLVDDADEAFDTITRGMQEMPAALRGELLEASTEYGQFFDQLGFDAEEAFGALVSGAEDGMYGIDKTGDAIKEFTIRATDMSTSTVDAFDTIGLDAQKMAERILEGGSTAKGAFNEIIEGLLAIEDPVEQANTAIALFGTPLEDLSVGEIPDFLEGLTGIENKLDDVGGATERAGDMAYDNLRTRWTEAFREAQQAFLTFADVNVIPAVERILDAFEDDGLEGAIAQVKVEWQKAWPAIERWLNGTVTPALVEWGTGVGAEMAKALWAAFNDAIEAGIHAPLNAIDRALQLDHIIPGYRPSGPAGRTPAPRPPVPPRSNPEPPGRTTTPRSSSRPSSSSGRGTMQVLHDGGIVEGRPGEEVEILALAGERVQTEEQQRQSGGLTIGRLYVGTANDARKMSNELRKLAYAGAYGG